MSVYISNRLMDDRSMSRNAKIVYMALCSYNQCDKNYSPTYDQLRKITRMSQSVLSKALSDLEKGGHIRRLQYGKNVMYDIVDWPDKGRIIRNRYISTEFSTDHQLSELSQYGTLPLLLYTWAIPHMDDKGRIESDCDYLKFAVIPAVNATKEEVEEAVKHILEIGLWEQQEIDYKTWFCMPEYAWLKFQYQNATQLQRGYWNKFRKRLAPLVFERDGYKCCKCGSTEYLEVDHITPLSKGGDSELSNLQTLCRMCNQHKGQKGENFLSEVENG